MLDVDQQSRTEINWRPLKWLKIFHAFFGDKSSFVDVSKKIRCPWFTSTYVLMVGFVLVAPLMSRADLNEPSTSHLMNAFWWLWQRTYGLSSTNSVDGQNVSWWNTVTSKPSVYLLVFLIKRFFLIRLHFNRWTVLLSSNSILDYMLLGSWIDDNEELCANH